MRSARRLLAAVLPEPLLRPLRTAWHRAQQLDPRLLRRRAAFRRLNRGTAVDEILLRPGLRLQIDPRAREPFEWFCFRSLEMVAELDAFLAHSAGRRRFLDVGSCHGMFSLAFVHGRPEAEALAVEPSPLAWEVLAENLRRNAAARITPLQAALGAGPGTLAMRVSWHHLEACAADEPGAMILPLSTLDGLCAERGFRPDLVKIDVEGYEFAVLQGARRVLSEDRPEVFLELHPRRLAELGASADAVLGLLGELGYRVLDREGRQVRTLAGDAAVTRLVAIAPRPAGPAGPAR